MTKKRSSKELKIRVFKIGGHYYDLRPLPDLVRLYSIWGRVDHISENIDFDESSSATQMLSTVIHEGVEALKEQRNLDNLDHHTIINIEDGMLAILVDNPDFFIRCLEFVKENR